MKRRPAWGPAAAVLPSLVVGALLLGDTSGLAQTPRILFGPGIALAPAPADVDGYELLAAAQVAADAAAYRALMTIIQLDVDGPHVTEVLVAHDADGQMQIGRPERWLVGRDGEDAFLVNATTGTSLRLRTAREEPLDLEHLRDGYLVDVAGLAELEGGPATAVTLTRRDAMTPSERIFMDQATSLAVRRETYDLEGRPVRVVALRDLAVTGAADGAANGLNNPATEPTGTRLPLSGDGIALLDDAGWVAPSDLGGGFALTSATALADEDNDTLQLVYSDGFYQVSLFQQVGNLAAGSMEAATRYEHGGQAVWRWPGSEPERMVWSGDGRTFTIVSDAPMERLMQVIQPLPMDEQSGVTVRVRRGLRRLGGLVWPIDDGSD